MNKLFKSGGRKISFALIFIALAFIGQARAQVVDQILNRIEVNRKALVSLRSDITRGSYDPSLKEWSYDRGKVILITPSKQIKEGLLRIDWKQPRNEILTVIKNRYYAYVPELNQVYTGAANSKKAQQKGGSIFSFLSMSKAQIKANYMPAEYAGEEKLEGGVPTWHLKFVPKTASENKSVDIWVDGNGMIIQVKTVPKSGDESFVRLTNFERNPKLHTSQFQIDPPPGVKEVKG